MITPEDLQQLPITGRKTIPEDYLDDMNHMNVIVLALSILFINPRKHSKNRVK